MKKNFLILCFLLMAAVPGMAQLKPTPTTGSGTGGGSSSWSLLTGKPTDLVNIANLTPANDDILQRKAGVWTNRTVAQYKTDLGLATVATSGSASDLGAGTVPLARLAGITTAELSATAGITSAQLAGSIANAKLANSAITIAGTSTSLGGTITASSILDSLGATQGQIVYRGASGWVVLSPGTNGQFLQTGGAAANPSWASVTVPTAANPTASIGLTAVNGSASTFMRSDAAPALDQAISPTMTGAWIWSGNTGTFRRNAIGATSTDGLILENTTAAAAGAQQFSPRIRLTGQGWKTNATAASQAVDWEIENVPVQGAANPTTNLTFSAQVNGGGYGTVLSLTNAGVLQFGGTTSSFTGLRNSNTSLEARLADNSDYAKFRMAVFESYDSGGNAKIVRSGSNILGLAQDISINWANNSSFFAGTSDLGMNRLAAGVIRITNGSTGAGRLFVGTSSDTSAAQVDVRSQTVGVPAGQFQAASGESASAANAVFKNGAGTTTFSVRADGGLTFDRTITAGGTTGAQTINKAAFAVNFAAAATSLVVTNSVVTTTSGCLCTVQTNDATMTHVQAVPASGSVTLYANAAPTAETKVYCEIRN